VIDVPETELEMRFRRVADSMQDTQLRIEMLTNYRKQLLEIADSETKSCRCFLWWRRGCTWCDSFGRLHPGVGICDVCFLSVRGNYILARLLPGAVLASHHKRWGNYRRRRSR
jgi:hypothetical protein